MLCEPISPDNGEKVGDNLSGNRLINLKILTTNIEKFIACQTCAQEKAIQIKPEEERDQ